jgi:hypothetical protein
MASSLRQDLKPASQPNSKELQDRVLMIIRKAVKADEAKRQHQEAQALGGLSGISSTSMPKRGGA